MCIVDCDGRFQHAKDLLSVLEADILLIIATSGSTKGYWSVTSFVLKVQVCRIVFLYIFIIGDWIYNLSFQLDFSFPP